MRGYDGHKKLNGRKRHALVDTTGLPFKVKVLPANMNDRKGGQLLLSSLHKNFSRLKRIWADQGYTGEFKRWIEARLEFTFEVVYRLCQLIPYRVG